MAYDLEVKQQVKIQIKKKELLKTLKIKKLVFVKIQSFGGI